MEDILRTIVYVALILVVIVVIVWLLRSLFGALFIVPVAAVQEDAGSTTIETNETEIHVTCTENIEGLVADCG